MEKINLFFFSIKWLKQTGIGQTVRNLVLYLNWIPTDIREVPSVHIRLLCIDIRCTCLQMLADDRDTGGQYLWERREILLQY